MKYKIINITYISFGLIATKAALLSGDIDLVWGAGVLPDADINEISDDPNLKETIRVFHSDAIQNKMMILNSGSPPFDDINVRKAVIRE